MAGLHFGTLSLLDQYIQRIHDAPSLDADRWSCNDYETEVRKIIRSAKLGSQTALDAILHVYQETREKNYSGPPNLHPAVLAATILDSNSTFRNQQSFENVFNDLTAEKNGDAIYRLHEDSYVHEMQQRLSYQASRFLFSNEFTVNFEGQLQGNNPPPTINLLVLNSAFNTLAGAKNDQFITRQFGEGFRPGLLAFFRCLPKFRKNVKRRKVRSNLHAMSWYLLGAQTEQEKQYILNTPKWWLDRLHESHEHYSYTFVLPNYAIKFAKFLLSATLDEMKFHKRGGIFSSTKPNEPSQLKLSYIGKILLAKCIVLGQTTAPFLKFSDEFDYDQRLDGSGGTEQTVHYELFFNLQANTLDIQHNTNELIQKIPELSRYVEYFANPKSNINFDYNNSIPETCAKIEES